MVSENKHIIAKISERERWLIIFFLQSDTDQRFTSSYLQKAVRVLLSIIGDVNNLQVKEHHSNLDYLNTSGRRGRVCQLPSSSPANKPQILLVYSSCNRTRVSLVQFLTSFPIYCLGSLPQILQSLVKRTLQVDTGVGHVWINRNHQERAWWRESATTFFITIHLRRIWTSLKLDSRDV